MKSANSTDIVIHFEPSESFWNWSGFLGVLKTWQMNDKSWKNLSYHGKLAKTEIKKNNAGLKKKRKGNFTFSRTFYKFSNW